MPKIAFDYSKTVIYKIVCKDLNVKDCYVGYTTNFIKRKANHKKACCNENDRCYNYKIYQKIREHNGWQNWEMILVENFPCKNSQEACARERYWYETLGGNLNSCVPGRTKIEYREENKEQILEQAKQYYEQNKEQIAEKMKQYYEQNKEKLNQKNECKCGGCYSTCHKTHHFKTVKHQKYLEQLNQNKSDNILDV